MLVSEITFIFYILYFFQELKPDIREDIVVHYSKPLTGQPVSISIIDMFQPWLNVARG